MLPDFKAPLKGRRLEAHQFQDQKQQFGRKGAAAVSQPYRRSLCCSHIRTCGCSLSGLAVSHALNFLSSTRAAESRALPATDSSTAQSSQKLCLKLCMSSPYLLSVVFIMEGSSRSTEIFLGSGRVRAQIASTAPSARLALSSAAAAGVSSVVLSSAQNKDASLLSVCRA